MKPITHYQDDASQTTVERVAHEWPQECLDLAGRFADFPLREQIPATHSVDVPRHVFDGECLASP